MFLRRGAMGGWQGLSFVLFMGALLLGIITTIGIINIFNGQAPQEEHAQIFFVIGGFALLLSIGISIAIWVPKRHRQIDAKLESLRQTGHRTTAEFAGKTIRGGGRMGAYDAAPIGRRDTKSSFWVKYIDENGRRRRQYLQERFTWEEVRRFERMGTFPVACHGTWVVTLTEH